MELDDFERAYYLKLLSNVSNNVGALCINYKSFQHENILKKALLNFSFSLLIFIKKDNFKFFFTKLEGQVLPVPQALPPLVTNFGK